jgi:TetR/AcrR family transcriptional repressor of nem operon
MPDVPRKAARKQAASALATMMGTLVLSRIAGTGEFSEDILAGGREAVLGRASQAKAAKRSIPPKSQSSRH